MDKKTLLEKEPGLGLRLQLPEDLDRGIVAYQAAFKERYNRVPSKERILIILARTALPTLARETEKLKK